MTDAAQDWNMCQFGSSLDDKWTYLQSNESAYALKTPRFVFLSCLTTSTSFLLQ